MFYVIMEVLVNRFIHDKGPAVAIGIHYKVIAIHPGQDPTLVVKRFAGRLLDGRWNTRNRAQDSADQLNAVSDVHSS